MLDIIGRSHKAEPELAHGVFWYDDSLSSVRL